jgi:DNA replication protein DnaC
LAEKTGADETYIGAALADPRAAAGIALAFFGVPRLLEELALARAAAEYGSLLGKLSRIHVLVLDDFLLNPMTDTERRPLLQVIEDRHDRSSTMLRYVDCDAKTKTGSA